MHRSWPHFTRLLLLCAALLLAPSCDDGSEPNDDVDASEPEEKCSVTADCSKINYVCTMENVCRPINSDRPCLSDGDCLGNERCSEQKLCYVPGVDPDADLSEVSDQEELPDELEPDELDDDKGEEIRDTTPPTVVARSPEPDAVDVPLDATITVGFDEAMFPSTVQDLANFVVKDSSNRVIDGSIAWNDATLTATFTPTQPWWPLSTYSVTLNSGIMDLSRNSLIELRWSFTTTQAGDASFYAQLARAYAPVIYQDVADTKLDVPLQVDYDGDLRPYNNAANINSGQKAATLYYSVAETETHFFIHYVLYYPVYKASSSAERQV
ncbi:MAG: Ig-like domain-containing protein, partial [Myxococcota bacterium]|nr:Ig-like domain-containing protein [Myxococcota bacterium]